jgi:hypothetical protein
MKEKLQIASRILEQEEIYYSLDILNDCILIDEYSLKAHILRRLLDIGVSHVTFERDDTMPIQIHF